jgi:hypothetical protein
MTAPTKITPYTRRENAHLILEDVEANRAVDEEIVPSARYCFERAAKEKFSNQSKRT